MPIKIFEFLIIPNNEEITDILQTLYQQKFKSLFFVAITTQPDIVFAVLWFLRFNQQPKK